MGYGQWENELPSRKRATGPVRMLQRGFPESGLHDCDTRRSPTTATCAKAAAISPPSNSRNHNTTIDQTLLSQLQSAGHRSISAGARRDITPFLDYPHHPALGPIMQSRVTPCGYSSESCGYCKDASSGRRSQNSRACYYFSSSNLTVDVYQLLVDRGWRRSGTIFYKPDVLRHCCPHYTIRLPVASFKPSKDQRRTVNKWNDYVLGEEYQKEATKLYPKTREEKARLKTTFDLISEVCKADVENIKRPPEPAHRFEVTLEPADFTVEKFEVFKNYQQNVHKEKPSEISQSGFKRFLCASPLQKSSEQTNGKTQLLGSYHQCYRLDGRLIAMGVLDLLPHCVSAVYLIYHSDFEKWQFGKLSALRETVLALEGSYQYYYMGYYIHSCTKMRYKGDYKPQHVLDPETYEWNPLEGELKELLDKKAYVSLSRERRAKGAAKPTTVENANMEPLADDSQPTDLSEFTLATAAEGGKAVQNGMSLFDLKVPGLMTVEEIGEQLNLDAMPIRVRGRMAKTRDLMSWNNSDIRDPHSVKGIVGELVACLGSEASSKVVVELG
ncbi:hypothetical protein P153DRAFT_365803 [Dothidotthia symphoricarpi CBS 119687]|uniref:arginyltransferase n=1 Tax=Dothidotthia symphoricarpi CBS 119687 TaxID=1392245 RepID=A0A6A6AGU3_9PLEO|nr:uncharacterized protein P153DRAFT_365803 [Dothidotthia symphoricarpi CBS 119687]KAF2131212.1 hypothetical protein P153DRAFT_365803 [Dothidotthia symphoricarpi CBS 119687]